MAQTLNGSIDGQISSQRAKLYVHMLRDKIDLLLIGGDTIELINQLWCKELYKRKRTRYFYL